MVATEEPAEGKREREAEGIVFDRVPMSPEAKALTGHLLGRFLEHEQRTKPRQRGRGQGHMADLEQAIGRFAGGLARSVDDGERLPASFPKDNNAYAKDGGGQRLPVTRTAALAAYDAFLEVDPPLIEVAKRASWRELFPADPEARTGRAVVRKRGRIRATEAFVGLLRDHGIAKGTAALHFPRRGRPRPLVLRTPSIRWLGEKIAGRERPIPDNETTQRLRSEVEELNGYIQGKLSGVELDGWTRIFAADSEGRTKWDRGGRLYAKPGGYSYQSLGKAERLALRLDREAVVEVDIKASHLALAYNLRGRSLDADLYQRGEEDPYLIGGLPRPVVKLFVTAALGAGQAPSKWPRGSREKMLRKQDIDLKRHKVGEVAKVVLARHPVLSDLTGITWDRLQFIEGKAVINAVLRLKREFDIPCLPVHDSLIVPVSAWWVARDVLHLALRAVGCSPLPFTFSRPEASLPRPEETRYAGAWRKLLGELCDF